MDPDISARLQALLPGAAPFSLSAGAPALAPRPLGVELSPLDALSGEGAALAERLLLANALAFGGPRPIPMPRWVLLDCALLPGAVIGAAVPKARAPGALIRALAAEGLPGEALLPAAAYCAAPALEPGLFVGFSLFSLVPGLARLMKAVALVAYGARRQLGVAQYGSPALRTHAALAPLEIVRAEVPLHERASEALIYCCEVPPREILAARALSPHEERFDLEIDPADTAALEDIRSRRRRGERVEIVWGPRRDRLRLRFPESPVGG
jgi:hypothetical protein